MTSYHWACCCSQRPAVHGVILKHGADGIFMASRIHDDWASHHSFQVIRPDLGLGPLSWSLDEIGYVHVVGAGADIYNPTGLAHSYPVPSTWGSTEELMETDTSLMPLTLDVSPQPSPGIAAHAGTVYICAQFAQEGDWERVDVWRGTWQCDASFQLGHYQLVRLVPWSIVGLTSPYGVHFLAQAVEFYGAGYQLVHVYNEGGGWLFEKVGRLNLWTSINDVLAGRICMTRAGTIYVVDRIYDSETGMYAIRVHRWAGGNWSSWIDHSLQSEEWETNWGIAAYRKPGQTRTADADDYPVLIFRDGLYYIGGGGGWTQHEAWSSHGLTPALDLLYVDFDNEGRCIVHGIDSGLQYQVARYRLGSWEYYQVVFEGAPQSGWVLAW